MPYLSHQQIETIAGKVIDQYKHLYVPQKRLCYNVNPFELASMLDLSVDFQILSDDCTILGMTSPGEVCVTLFDDRMNEIIYYLDGKTILLEKRLLLNPWNKGKLNFTLTHEIGHQIVYRLFPEIYGTDFRMISSHQRKHQTKKITDWEEWQADSFAAALLLPEDAVRDAMFYFGLGDRMKMLSKKYSENNYKLFCEMADFLNASRSALAFRMEQLGLLDNNKLIPN